MPNDAHGSSAPAFLAFARQHTFVAIFGVIAPITVFCTFVGYPIVCTIYLSFFDWNGERRPCVSSTPSRRSHCRFSCWR